MSRLLGCTLLGLALCAGALPAQGGKDGKEVVGKIKEVQLAKKAFTITLESGKERTFLVNDDTRFVGPKGGVSAEGLKDDRMVKGNEVKVVPAADNKTAKEVKLPIRKKADKDKKDK
ncbi:MAG TPA: hypothetical protein VEL76_05010 [Gemmataceae bacterium]|nr:hypothetical protein [Gemmataceae bacterium]